MKENLCLTNRKHRWHFAFLFDLKPHSHECFLLQVETVIAGHELVAESAVVGFPHEVKGESICAFVTLKEEAAKVLKNDVDKQVP